LLWKAQTLIPVFLSTSGLIAVVNQDDQWQTVAENVWREVLVSQAPLITTSLVMIELGDGLARIQHRRLAIVLCERIHASPRFRVIHISAKKELQGWELFRDRPDKEWGLTDCVSIVTMQEHGAECAFSTEHHFEQAGFRVLLQTQ
jgi:predicted nucleic acid-binding protein